jgi:hypothetical protein
MMSRTAPATGFTRLRERLAGAGRDESGSVRTVSATATARRIDGSARTNSRRLVGAERVIVR